MCHILSAVSLHFLIASCLFYFYLQDSAPLGQVPLAGNKIIKHAPLDDEMGKYAFEIAGEYA